MLGGLMLLGVVASSHGETVKERASQSSIRPLETETTGSSWGLSLEAADLSYLHLGESLDNPEAGLTPITVPVPTPLIIGAVGLVTTLLIRSKVRS